MKEADDVKMYYFFDEAGTPEILGRKGVNLVANGNSSKIFIVGFISTSNPKAINDKLRIIHDQIADDPYLASIPSISSTKRMFHCNVRLDGVNFSPDPEYDLGSDGVRVPA